MEFPSKVKVLLSILQRSGFEAFVVGGCVRDYLLSKKPNDWDITTSATPDEIKKVFKNYKLINNNGEKHGTVTIRFEDENFEITTYRIETDYSDHRHPEKVEFTASLNEDLKRRDFTINAMALGEDGILHNPIGYDGHEDLKNKIIRAVGNPLERFKEDALRILRMIRFASVLDFTIEDNTLDCAWRLREDLEYISKERIREEINKFLCGKGFKKLCLNYQVIDILKVVFPHIKSMIYFDQRSRYHKHDLWLHTINVVDTIENRDYMVAMAGFLHDIGKLTCYQEYTSPEGKQMLHFVGHPVVSYEMAISILNELKYSQAEMDIILTLILNHDFTFTGSVKNIKKVMNAIQSKCPTVLDYVYRSLINLKFADWQDHDFGNSNIEIPSKEKMISTYEYIISQSECFSLKDLAINGNDLIALGFKPSPIMKTILNDCLDKVINEELENNRDNLIAYIKLNY